jgi:hypothetical protein
MGLTKGFPGSAVSTNNSGAPQFDCGKIEYRQRLLHFVEFARLGRAQSQESPLDPNWISLKAREGA